MRHPCLAIVIVSLMSSSAIAQTPQDRANRRRTRPIRQKNKKKSSAAFGV